MMSGPPFKRKGNAVVDRSGEVVELMGASVAIMHRLTTDPLFRGCKVVRLTGSLRAAECYRADNTISEGVSCRALCFARASPAISCPCSGHPVYHRRSQRSCVRRLLTFCCQGAQ